MAFTRASKINFSLLEAEFFLEANPLMLSTHGNGMESKIGVQQNARLHTMTRTGRMDLNST